MSESLSSEKMASEDKKDQQLHQPQTDHDPWGINSLSPDFPLIGVSDNAYSFLQSHSPASVNDTSNNKASPSTTGKSFGNSKDAHQQNFLLNHYQNLLNQNKVSMKEALSPGSYISPTANANGSNSNGTSPENMNITPFHPDNNKPLSQQNNPSPSIAEVFPSLFQNDQLGNISTNSNITSNSLGNNNKKSPNPCDHCRRRQIKCVMIPNLKNCIQCETKGIRCTQSENPSNPVLKRNMGVVSENGEYVNNKRPRLQKQNSFQSSSQISRISPQSTSSTNAFKKPQPPSAQYPRSSYLVGSTSMFDSCLMERIKLDKIDQVQLSPTLSLRKVGYDAQFILSDDFTEELALSADRSVDEVENLVAPFGQQLVNIYFRVIHPSFPILHRKVFLEKYSSSYREFAAPLLAAVYSLAIQWWDQDPNLSKHPKPSVNVLNALALKTFLEVTERPRLSAVQAGLLLLQCRSEHPNNWILCQQVVALAEELGLGLDCQNWKLPKWERGLRRRLAWAVFIQERWIALNEARVSHYTIGRNWLVANLTNEDFPEVPTKSAKQDENDYRDIINDLGNGKFLYKEMIELTLIMGQIMESFYTYNGIQNVTRIDQVLKLAKPLQLKLRQWYHSLPQTLLMTATRNSKLSSNGFLHLSYFAAEIALHRKIITCLTDDVPFELVKVCRSAATTRLVAVIDFIKLLKNEHIFAYWHSSTTHNFAIVGTFAAILYVTSSSAQESIIYKEYIHQYRVLLNKLGRNLKQARNALKEIDLLLYQIPGLLKETPLSAQQQQQHNSSLSPISMTSPTSNFQALSPYLQQQLNLNLPNAHNMPNNQPQHRSSTLQGNNNMNSGQNSKRIGGGGPPVTTVNKRNSNSSTDQTNGNYNNNRNKISNTNSPTNLGTPINDQQASNSRMSTPKDAPQTNRSSVVNSPKDMRLNGYQG